MRYQRWLTAVLLIFLVPCAHTQRHGSNTGGTSSAMGNVHVHVLFADAHRTGTNLQVRLMQGSSSTPVSTNYTNDAGQADFFNLPAGNYHVEITGDGIQTTQSEVFEVDPRRVTTNEYVTVRQLSGANAAPSRPSAAMVSTAEMNVPDKASKEVDKANEAMAQQEWKKALERLNKAIAIYPQYATAYNNLGVLYGRTNDQVHEMEALEKAISLNDHLAPALQNLGKLCLQQKDFPRAEAMLTRAVSADPGNTESLMFLADAQFMNQHYPAAIASAQRAHDQSQPHSSVVHYIAAQAYQRQNRPADALTELQTFLKEEPSGPRADHVRSDVAKLQVSTP